MAQPSKGLKLRKVCNELSAVRKKCFKIGVLLGIPYERLLEFMSDMDPLSAVVNYWLKGNVERSVVPISWKSIVAALRSDYVGEPGIADEIDKRYCQQEDTKIEYERFDLRTICNALGRIGTKWYKIGVQLEIPEHKLHEFGEEEDPLSAVVSYWLRGNVDDPDVPISWNSIVEAAGSVGEPGLAEEIKKRYCQQEDTPVKVSDQQDGRAPLSVEVLPSTLPIHDTHCDRVENKPNHPDQSAGYPPSGGEAATPQKSEFSVDFNSSELYGWLRSHQVPEKDCEEIKRNDIGGIAFKFTTESDGWGDYYITKPGMIVINKHLKKMLGIEQSDSVSNSTGRNGSVAIGPPELPQPASLPPPEALSLAVEFSENFNSSELYGWLRSHQVPEKDCEEIKCNDIGGIAFKLTTESDGWGDYYITKPGMIVINKHLKKMLGIEQSDSVSNSTGRNGSIAIGSPELPQPASLPPPEALSLAVEFSENFNSSELYGWLRSHQVPEKDCEEIKRNDIGGIAFKLTTESDGWGDYYITKPGMTVINKHLKKMLGIEQSDSVSNSTGRNGSVATGLPELPQPASLPPPEALSLAVGTVDSDGRNKVEQYHAVDRGEHIPQLKFEDSNDRIDDKIKPEELRILKEDKEYYPMNNPRHGVAIIINNKLFTGHKTRDGTDRDEHNLIETFRYLGYRVIVCRDLNLNQMTYIFSNLDDYLRHSDEKSTVTVTHDSFICCVLTHGNERAIFSSDSKEVSIEDIETSVGKSKRLRTKPKIFFIQACRGEKDGSKAVERVAADCTTSQKADFYLSFATTLGDKSYRDMFTGSWFITEVCKILYQYSKSSSLNDIQLLLNRSVANNEDYRYKKSSQQPSSANQLHYNVHFFFGLPK